MTTPRPTLVKERSSGIWHVSYTVPETGRTRKLSTGAKDREDAERAMPAIVAKIFNPVGYEKASYKLGALLGAYLHHHETFKIKNGRKDTIYYALKNLQSYFAGFSLDQLNDAAWQAYRDHRTKQPNRSAAMRGKGKFVTDATACRELSTLRGALSWGRRNNWKGLENVRVHIPNEPKVGVAEYLTRAEALRLIAACVEPHQRLFVRLALATGARMSALLQLKWENVHWPAGVAKPLWESEAFTAVNPRPCPIQELDFDLEMKEPMRIDLGVGRGNKRRGTGVIGKANVALYDDLYDAYSRRQSEFVIEYRGAPLSKVDLAPAYRRAGLNYQRRQHLLKHTCVSWLVQEGVSYEKIAKLIGTRSNIIEKHYGHLSPEHLDTVGNVLSI